MKDQLLKKLQDEIIALDRELKMELPKEIKRARELGDLRENAEYHAAKERQTYVQARIAMLQQRVSALSLINLDKLPKDRAAFGSRVHVIENGSELVYRLVMPEDADVDQGLISISSPIGRAFVGKEAGDEVHVVTPNGKRTFEIVKLLTVHDLA
jgi:transcription elongation factor GreA